MIVVVASSYDARARNIVAHWGPRCAALLTAEELCTPGWRLTVLRLTTPTAVIGGKTIPADEVHGILTLRPCIFPEELRGIHANHRKYVAAELNAFLLAWLTAQSCPVWNRPTACCLAGPNWRGPQWTQAAARLGIPAQTQSADGEALEVVSIGERCFGCDDPILKDRTSMLARAAGVDLLAARFSKDSGCFVSASAWPPLSDPALLEAVRDGLESRS